MLEHRLMWRILSKEKRAKSYHVVQYHVLRALERADGDLERAKKHLLQSLSKAFTPVKRQSCLQNGHAPFGAAQRAAFSATYHRSFVKPQDVLGAPWRALGDLEDKFVQLCQWIDLDDPLPEYYQRHYVYIFVRQDIPAVHQLVQAAHATYVAGAQFLYNMGAYRMYQDVPTPDKQYFTVIGVPDEGSLDVVIEKLKHRGIRFTAFIEPDIDDQKTALATEPIPARNRGDLMEYRLLTLD